ncbi:MULTISPECIES: CU044_2847 family protein [unclassified Streptomyces]|uniref:CU044_2847 family protein n=1 Tax=unclassified Streptomyces TaxID=2593676 RepID=UPI002E1F88D2|nr:hypothetical protein OG217_16765 [Streptomyces sp. NBC_01023]
MSTTPDLELDDGTPVRFLLTPVDGAAPAPAADRDLPEGMGQAVPVAAGGRAVASFAAGALRGVFKPLGPLLQEVHHSVSSVPDPPTELSVAFGVQVGQDLKFGIVGSNGQAHLTVTASWKPAQPTPPAQTTPQAPAAPAPNSTPDANSTPDPGAAPAPTPGGE